MPDFMHHHHGNCAHHHGLSYSPKAKMRPLAIAFVLISGFALAELIIGSMSHSLALIAESGHMVSDGLALGIALIAAWVATFPSSNQAPFGYRRVEILAALVNGVGLVAIALWIFWEAMTRLQAPTDEILGIPMLITAIVGVGVNSLNAFLLHDHSHTDLNLRGAFLHMVADAISSLGVLIAAIAIWKWQWYWADGAVSLFVSILILIGAIPLIWQSLNILLEKTPAHVDVDQIRSHLESFAKVVRVDQIRVWAIALGQEALVAHLTVNIADGAERDQLLRQIHNSLQTQFGIEDITLQFVAPLSSRLMSLSVPTTLELISSDENRYLEC
jgi:cobalt-zinc-cadmium efflux system protein